MRKTTLLKFSKNKFFAMLAMSHQNIESHNFDIEIYQTETVKFSALKVVPKKFSMEL